jgi:cobalamin biosynthesis Mg chelatase CobN
LIIQKKKTLLIFFFLEKRNMILSKQKPAQQKTQIKKASQASQVRQKTQSKKASQAQSKKASQASQAQSKKASQAQSKKASQASQAQSKKASQASQAQSKKPIAKPVQVPVAKPAQVPTRTRQEQRQDRLQKAQKLRFDRQNHNLQLKMKRNMINENMIKAKAKRGSSAGFWVMVVFIVLGGLGSLMYFIVAPFLGWITNPIGSFASMFNPKKWF